MRKLTSKTLVREISTKMSRKTTRTCYNIVLRIFRRPNGLSFASAAAPTSVEFRDIFLYIKQTKTQALNCIVDEKD